MLIYFLAFVGSVLTVLSPCICRFCPLYSRARTNLSAVPACLCRWEWRLHFPLWQSRLHPVVIG